MERKFKCIPSSQVFKGNWYQAKHKLTSMLRSSSLVSLDLLWSEDLLTNKLNKRITWSVQDHVIYRERHSSWEEQCTLASSPNINECDNLEAFFDFHSSFRFAFSDSCLSMNLFLANSSSLQIWNLISEKEIGFGLMNHHHSIGICLFSYTLNSSIIIGMQCELKIVVVWDISFLYKVYDWDISS